MKKLILTIKEFDRRIDDDPRYVITYQFLNTKNLFTEIFSGAPKQLDYFSNGSWYYKLFRYFDEAKAFLDTLDEKTLNQYIEEQYNKEKEFKNSLTKEIIIEEKNNDNIFQKFVKDDYEKWSNIIPSPATPDAFAFKEDNIKYQEAIKFVQEKYCVKYVNIPYLLIGDVATLIKLTTGVEVDIETLTNYNK